MYTQEQLRIIEKVEHLIAAEGSQSKACQKLGISQGVISPIRKGTYTGNVDMVFEKLREYFDVKMLNQATLCEVEYVDTFISHEVYEVIRICQVKGGLAIACGDAGIGKTKAARKFISDNPNSSIMITINPCFTSVKAILELVAERIGAAPESSRDKMWLSIAGKLRDGMVLIFDEAQHLTNKSIEVLRSFSDHFADRGQTLGIVFIGNINTVGRMGSKKAEFAQIVNRTKQTKTYSVSQIGREDIQKLFPLIADKKNEIDFLWRISQTRQALRGAVNLFSNAYDNDNYTYQGLVAMAKYMDMNW